MDTSHGYLFCSFRKFVPPWPYKPAQSLHRRLAPTRLGIRRRAHRARRYIYELLRAGVLLQRTPRSSPDQDLWRVYPTRIDDIRHSDLLVSGRLLGR